MRPVRTRLRNALSAVGVALALSAAPVEAGGFYSPYLSATAIATAFAGASARSDDAGFFLYNPATISGLTETQSYIDMRAFSPSAHISPAQATTPAGIDISADGESGDIASAAIAPGSVTALRLTPQLTLGWGSSASFASDVKTDIDWGGRFQLLSTRIVSLGMTAAVSYELTPQLAISAGVKADRLDTRFANTALLPAPGGAPIEAISFMKGKDWGAGAVAGAVLKPFAGTRIGVSYHSSIAHTINGYAAADFRGFPAEHTRYDLELPQYATAGVEQRVDEKTRIFAELQWIDWSAFGGFDIAFRSGRPNEQRPIEWKDTWLIAAGFAYELDGGTELSGGISYDTAASQNGSGQTLSPDANKLMLGVGATRDIANVGRVTLSYAHVFAEDAPVSASHPATGTLQGTLSAHIDMIGLGITHKW